MQYIKEAFTFLQSNNRTTITLPTTEIINPLTVINAYKVLDETPSGARDLYVFVKQLKQT